MKKVFCFMLFCLLSVGCHSTYRSGPLFSESEPKPKASATVKTVASSSESIGVPVVMKAHGENFVMYEYKNVRVDQIWPLAQDYCKTKNESREAVLRDIILYRNNMRRATFDCQ